MIDTDKYEGHTEGPWEQYSAAAYHAVVLPGDIELIPPKLADAQLIADAPLLLAEVRRLQHAMIYVSMKIFWNENGIPYEYTQLMEYCRQHCGEPDDMSGKLGQMISEFEDEFPYQEESE